MYIYFYIYIYPPSNEYSYFIDIPPLASKRVGTLSPISPIWREKTQKQGKSLLSPRPPSVKNASLASGRSAWFCWIRKWKTLCKLETGEISSYATRQMKVPHFWRCWCNCAEFLRIKQQQRDFSLKEPKKVSQEDNLASISTVWW